MPDVYYRSGVAWCYSLAYSSQPKRNLVVMSIVPTCVFVCVCTYNLVDPKTLF